VNYEKKFRLPEGRVQEIADFLVKEGLTSSVFLLSDDLADPGADSIRFQLEPVDQEKSSILGEKPSYDALEAAQRRLRSFLESLSKQPDVEDIRDLSGPW
jgi:hypothetical protein